MARAWPASRKWPYEVDSYDYLAKSLSNAPISVYHQADTSKLEEDYGGNSFDPYFEVKMPYPEFLAEMSETPIGFAMRLNTGS